MLLLLSASGWAQQHLVATTAQLQRALSQASAQDEVVLAAGVYHTQVQIDKPLIVSGSAAAIIDAGGRGSALVLGSNDITIRGLSIRNWGADLYQHDAAIRGRDIANIQLLDNQLSGPGFGIRFDNASNVDIRGNQITGALQGALLQRGDTIYLKNVSATRITANTLVGGRDGVYLESSDNVVITDNRMSQQQYPVHFMYAKDSSASGNDSQQVLGGYAIMGSKRIDVIGNRLRDAIEFGLLLNMSTDSRLLHNDVARVTNPRADHVFDGEGKGVFIYGAQNNTISGNRLQQCQIGISMAMGGEGNRIDGNQFVHNGTQVKYVGTAVLDWSHDGVGNYWSSYSGWDLNGDGIGDQSYRPNDALDRLFWIYPEGRFLMNSPVITVLRWLQRQFQQEQGSGIHDSHPLMTPPITAQMKTQRQVSLTSQLE
ncbi:nitrous oxide reductase family maturation protein NosD [uncultured Ferrimonas sp.]|uniref:nitrous oxide reductase family maturation protein NosD n=1 Tax=uncultured Ferrimonas sp. TaxID=432640 RepID=UPI00260FCFFC|nr:nitrous oxide reductase family maturation protein NosD [uncultured Ferrimonas sp.]